MQRLPHLPVKPLAAGGAQAALQPSQLQRMQQQVQKLQSALAQQKPPHLRLRLPMLATQRAQGALVLAASAADRSERPRLLLTALQRRSCLRPQTFPLVLPVLRAHRLLLSPNGRGLEVVLPAADRPPVAELQPPQTQVHGLLQLRQSLTSGLQKLLQPSQSLTSGLQKLLQLRRRQHLHRQWARALAWPQMWALGCTWMLTWIQPLQPSSPSWLRRTAARAAALARRSGLTPWCLQQQEEEQRHLLLSLRLSHRLSHRQAMLHFLLQAVVWPVQWRVDVPAAELLLLERSELRCLPPLAEAAAEAQAMALLPWPWTPTRPCRVDQRLHRRMRPHRQLRLHL